ncbi:VCBS repeat-containing protein [candidate division KSB1 bacterium]|nr:VCBS repeat-containing protein [candidate division KSB1 bacterium]
MLSKSFFILAIAVFFIPSIGYTQLYVVWEKTYNDPGKIWDVEPTGTGEFVFVGEDRIVKTDASGNIVTATAPAGSGTDLRTIHKTTDDFYMVGGSTDGPYDDWDMFYSRLNNDLTTNWSLTKRYFEQDGMEEILHGRQLADGNHVFCGYYNYFRGYTLHDHHGTIFKVNNSGTLLWQSSGGTSGGYGDKAMHVEQVVGGDIYLAGTDLENSKGWLAKFTNSGGYLETKTYNYSSTSWDELYFFQQTDVNNLIFAGFTTSGWPSWQSDVWLYKTTPTGTLIWNRKYGGANNDEGYCVRQVTDGNYLIAGKTESYGAGGSDAWLIKTDIHGNKLWDMTFGGTGDEEIRKILELSAGEYIACGKKGIRGWLLRLSSTPVLLAPGLVEPIADKIGIGVDLWLNWIPSGTPDFYDLEVDNSPNFSSPVFTQNNIAGERCYVPPLSYNGQYHWRVRAKKGATTTAWSDPRTFTTMGPPPVTINSPAGYVLTYLEAGDQYYIDRSYIVHSIPNDLRNYLWIKTANDDKNVTSASHLSFTLNNTATVYVGYDHRATSLPVWLTNGFLDTGQIVEVSDELEYLKIYKKSFPAGLVTLGGNKNGGGTGANSNYTVFLDILPSLFTLTPTDLQTVQKGKAIWGDYDKDGDLDIFLTGQNAGNVRIAKLYQNDGAGGFQEVVNNFTDVRSSAAEFGDYDNDGDLDILYCGQAAGDVAATRLYRNDGNNNFAPVAPGLANITSGDVAWGDFDNDGDLDILMMGTSSIVTKLYKNQGNDTFDEYIAGLKNLKAGTADWLDYDLDGDMDILLTGEDDTASPNSLLYRNNGDGTFTNVKTFENIYMGLTAIGDYDNDGDPDIFLSGNTKPGFKNRLYRNDGGGVFTAVNTVLPDIDLGSADWGDYDNDGDLDLLVTGRDSQNNRIARVYTNTGGGNFTDLGAGLPGVYTGSGLWGDFDNDDDLDILLCGLDNSGNTVTAIYSNRTQIKNTIPQAPADLIVTPSTNDTSFTLSWSAATDNQTPQQALTYNLRIGTQAGANDVLGPMALNQNGYRQIVKTGNAGHNTSWVIKNMPEGEYFWSVQAVDNARAGSRFAGEASFTYIPVPVELADFNAVQDKNCVLVSWQTATETVNRGFNIYRRIENNGSFTKINPAVIPGAGTTSSAQKYSFTDSNISPSTIYYYKLEQIDLDGETTFYGPCKIKTGPFDLPEKFALKQNHPNPFNPETWITWHLPDEAHVNITIYNIKGEMVSELADRLQSAGVYKVKWDGRTVTGQICPSGIYLVRMQADGFTDIIKMVLAR